MRIFAWDTETWRIVPGRTAPPMVCLSYCWDGGDKGVVSAPEGLAMLRRALADTDVILVGHNVAFDVCVACALDETLLPLFFAAYAQGRVRCTQVRELLIAIADGTLEVAGRPKRFSMEAICFDRFGEDLSAEKKSDSWRLNYHRLAGIPLEEWPQEALDYPVRDAHRTFRMYAAQTCDTSPIVNADGTLVNEGEQTAAAFCLALAGVWGMRTEPEAVATLTASFTARSQELAAILREEGILRDNGTKDTKRVKTLVEEAYAALGQDVKRTATGAVSTERAVLAKTSHRGLLALAESTGVEKMLGTYVPVLEQGTRTPINPGWNVLVATGRTSCREPNLQNLPRKGGIRECFVPRAGWLYAAADYSTLELCALAQVCLDLFGWSNMADALRAGQDLHVRMAANILGVPYEEAITRYAADDKEVADKRQLAKCFHPDTEVLTRTGWKRIPDLAEGEEVVAAYPSTGGGIALAWEVPTQVFTKPSPGSLVHLRNEGIDLRVTDDHRMLAFCNTRGNVGTPKVVVPEDMGSVRYWANAGVHGGGALAPDANLLRLAVATQADGNYPRNGKQIRFGFTKQRKIDRLLELLTPHGADAYRVSTTSQGATQIVINAALAEEVKALLDGKRLPLAWLSLTPESRKVVLEEAQHWDGTAGKRWRMWAYVSTEKQNIDVLQALASMSGYKTRVSVSARPNAKHAPCYRLAVKDRHLTRGGNLSVERVPYEGDVTCLSVPASFVLVRDGGIPVITGQCANFGYPGGLGAEKFQAYALASYGVNIDLDTSRDLKQTWLETWPETRPFFDHVNQQIGYRGSFTLEQVRSGRLRGDVGYCDGCNSYFQGLAADGAKAAMWMISQECYLGFGDAWPRDGRAPSPLFGARVVAFIHDEFLIEARDDANAGAAGDRLAAVMVEGMARYIPDIPIKAEPVLMRRWLKGAKTTRDANGTLIPWTPKEKKA